MRRGAQKGNKNAAKGKSWEDAIRRALARSQGTVDKGLDKVADGLVADAIDGDAVARAEIGNRLDGKARESVEISKTTYLVKDERLQAIRKSLRKVNKPAASTIQ